MTFLFRYNKWRVHFYRNIEWWSFGRVKRWNSGNPYTDYRFGPFSFRKYQFGGYYK